LSFSFSFLLTKLKENQSEKISMMLEPEENSGLRGKKDGKIPWALMQESMRQPLAIVLWQLVRECSLYSID